MKYLFFILLLHFTVATNAQIKRHYDQPDNVLKLQTKGGKQLAKPVEIEVGAKYNFIHYGIADGLSSNKVREIYVDSRNYIWFATSGGGVSIYDGKNFRTLNSTHGLSHDIVHDFIEDDDGRMWIATDVGVSIFDGKNWEYLSMENGDIGSEVVLSLMQDSKGRIWMGTNRKGFSIYDQGKMEHHFEIGEDTTAQIKCMFEDPKSGDVWMGTHGSGVYQYKDSSTIVKHILVNERHNPNNIVWSITVHEENDSMIVYAGSQKSLWRYAGDGFKMIESGETYAAGAVLDFTHDHKGNLWISSGNGIARWSPTDTVIFGQAQGLKEKTVFACTEDNWGNIWLATWTQGISKFLGEKFVHYGTETGLPSEVVCTFRDRDDNIWIGLEKDGVVKYDGESFYHFGLDEGFINDHGVLAIAQDSAGTLWFGQRKAEITSFDGTYFRSYEKTNPPDYHWDVNSMVYHNDRVWIGHSKGAEYIEGDSIYYHYFHGDNEFADYYIIWDLYIDNENFLWAGTYGGGVARFEEDFVKLIKIEHGLVTDAVSCISQDNHGNYWFNLSGYGLMILKAGALETPVKDWEWLTLSMMEGLPTNDTWSTMIQDDGDVWITTTRGLVKIILNGNDVFDNDYRIKTYSANEGFVGIECWADPVIGGDNRMWVVSNSNISLFNPRLDVHTRLSPTPILTNMKIHLKDVVWEEFEDAEYDEIDYWNNLPVNLSIPYEQNHVQLEFIGISHADPEGVEFSWKLNGFDEDWSPWSKTTSMTYSNLPWGEFEFELRCRDSFNNISEPAKIKFEIRKAYYHTWLFRLSILAMIIIMIYFIFRWRTAALKKRQRVLEDTVEKRTVEIKRAKEKIEHHQEEILDSISYAKRIQEAILPPAEAVKKMLDESFILYKPKDIVAGDFYWIEEVGDETYIAAADCTGHGVPGAMVSVVCSNALNNTVLQEGITDPGKILDRVTELVVEQFKKGNDKVKDGMDICLCRWNKKKGELVFAGAHNPLWKVSAGSGELEEFKASKQPVGQFDAMVPFESNVVPVEKGDRLYLFSDGFADQFGGPKGKKLKSKNFKKLITSIQNLSLTDQHSKLDDAFEEWKGELEQLDDVCVIGVEISH